MFTTPFNGYDNNAILALVDNRVEVLSADILSQHLEVAIGPFQDVSIKVDVCEKYFPRRVLRRVKGIGAIARRACARDGYVVTLHPNLTIFTDSWLRELSTTLYLQAAFRASLAGQYINRR